MNKTFYILKSKTMKKNLMELSLLPVQFKKVGIGLLLISVIINITGKSQVLAVEGELLKSIATIGLLISFLLLAISKDKIEDELTIKIRMTALATAFLFGVLEVIFQPIVHLIIEGEYFSEMNGTSMLIRMFLVYFAISFILKRRR